MLDLILKRASSLRIEIGTLNSNELRNVLSSAAGRVPDLAILNGCLSQGLRLLCCKKREQRYERSQFGLSVAERTRSGSDSNQAWQNCPRQLASERFDKELSRDDGS